MGRAVRALVRASLLAMLPATVAYAADLVPVSPLPPAPAPPAPPQWTVELGAEVRGVPRYQGSARYAFYPFPLLDVRDAGTPPRFHGPLDGFGYAVIDTQTFKAGPVVQVELGRF